MNTSFEKLFEPGYIGKVKIRNRLARSAAGAGLIIDPATNTIMPEGIAFYEGLAKGGVGLIGVENPSWIPGKIVGRPFHDDKCIQVERPLVDAIHKHGAACYLQLYDFGPLDGPHLENAHLPTRASSEFCYPTKLDMNKCLPHALTIEEIEEEVDYLASAALRAQKVGYDAVEIHAGCSHMFATFLSRFWNKRDDKYGPQSLENRARIVVEGIQEIKKRCGSDFAVTVMIPSFEVNVFEPGNNANCMTSEEAGGIAKLLEKAGADMIYARPVTIGSHDSGFFPDLFYVFGEPDTGYGRSMDFKKFWPEFITQYDGAGGFLNTDGNVKKAVSIPVMASGSVDPKIIPDLMESIIRDGKADFLAMNRALIADPELPNKMATGKLDDIRPCAHCFNCFGFYMMGCRVNPAYQRAGGPNMPEGYDVQPAPTKKKVLVVGGGPAGMEAARVAALRGHQVTLYEKSAKLGGLMPIAAMVKGPQEKIMDFVNYLSNQITKLGVRVELGKEVNLSVIDNVKPDVVIVANGGEYTTPDIPGINHPKVISNASLHSKLRTGLRFLSPFTLRSLTKFYMPVGKRVVIMGGQIQGVELAEFLLQRGKEVTIVDDGPEQYEHDLYGMKLVVDALGYGLPLHVLERTQLYLQAHGVKTFMGVKYNEITDEGLTITTNYGFKKTLEADSIILALPLSPNTALANSLKGKATEVYTIGDCSNPGLMIDAVAAGNLTARKI